MNGNNPKTHETQAVSFYRKEYRKLINFVRKRIKNIEESSAEDLVQDVALNLFSKPDFYSTVDNISYYIYRALRNRIIDLYRRKNRINKVTNIKNDSDHEIFQNRRDEYCSSEFKTDLFQALEELDAKHRQIWIAVELEYRNYEELSREWNIPKGTLLSRKHRAALQLKEKLNHWETDFIR